MKPSKQNLALRARYVCNEQKQRCYNIKNKAYKNYGAKGIKVEYEIQEFIKWWIHNFYKMSLKQPSVGRIDHSKNYSFDNIEMVERSSNSKEMIARTGGNLRRNPVVLVKDDFCMAFSTVNGAATFAKVSPHLICLRRIQKLKKESKLNFNYDVYNLDAFLNQGRSL